LSPLTAGATLCDGRYRLDAIVGRGGMAIVWRATDLQLEREVAIKVIADVLADDPRFVARFEREARLAAALNHPNLVKVFDYSVEEERPFLVMEYVGGGTLIEARGTPLNVDALARDLLDAVAHIHAAGILHRDIKPANVLLDADGAPRLSDFGIARGAETSTLTQAGQVLGTRPYIAPEVAAGEPATVRSDLYALGVMLGELRGPRSEALERLLPRLTARQPEDRPSSATEALAELDPTRVLVGDPDPTQRLEATKPQEQQGSLAPDRRSTRIPAGRPGPLRDRRISRAQGVAAAAVLVALLVLVVLAASGGGGHSPGVPQRQLQPASAGATTDQQIDRLERIVRAASRKR
jgi:eukaryotic-like serine/threonine-protein kinase